MSVELRGLSALIDEMATAPEPYRASPFWREVAAMGVQQIESAGFENFKRTVNLVYFCWDLTGILRHQLKVAGHWLTRPTARIFSARFENYRSPLGRPVRYYRPSNFRVKVPEITSFNAPGAWAYRTYVAMLWEFVARHDPLRLLFSIEEPRTGNPFLIHYRGCDTSQDVCNSVHEFYSAGGEEGAGRGWNIGELGCGYGRLAYVWLKALPDATYTLIDIPPALNLAQEYLGRVFPNERIFYFRPFRRFEDIREEFENARIRFLAAHQIELLPPKIFDRFLNISSLHEMTYPQIETYLRQIGRVCRGRFYTKQWLRSQAAVNGLIIRADEYPIPEHWKTVYHARHPIQGMFFHALYEVGG